MADKKKNDEQLPAPVPEEKPDGNVEKPNAPFSTPAAKSAPAATPPVAPARGGLRGRSKPVPAPLSALASATGTSPLVLAALKAAYGWTERTKLTRREFTRLRDEWLRRPANEV